MTTEKLQVYSSAYTRTQLSVQALLDAMLSDQCQSIPSVRVLPPEEDIINSAFVTCLMGDLHWALIVDDACVLA